jgi:hydroxymethylpyrimidine/phosphomethylpyrimidine kinase
MIPRPIEACLTIAGSDPSGGAGIQADLKTFTVLKVYGCAVITCLTAQNSKGVQAYQSVGHDFLRQQIRLVLEDLPIRHIKIGMVGTKEAAETIGEALSLFQGQIIYDPVLQASDGSSLIIPGTLEQLRAHVLSRATVITPNLPELQILTDAPCPDEQKALDQACRLFAIFPKLEAIALTGGHFPAESDEITDFLILRPVRGAKRETEIHKALHKRVKTRNTHGTGCTFSSAFTAYLLKEENHKKAFFKTVNFMDQLLRESALYDLGKGHGGLAHHLFKDNQGRIF